MNQTSTQTLLLELGCEELPAGSVSAMAQSLAAAVTELLQQSELLDTAASWRSYHTPRRLAVAVTGVRAQQPEQQIIRRGPAVSASFDGDGKPTKAAEGFARSVGSSVAELQRLQTDQGEWLMFEQHQPGRSLSEVLQEALAELLKKLPMPKTMRWGAHEMRFLRPLHWLLALHGEDVLPLQLAHLQAGRHSCGHRVHAAQRLSVNSADSYVEQLQQAFVLVDPVARKALIEQQIAAICKQLELQPHKEASASRTEYEALLDEVCELNEWPVALACAFDPDYLQLPDEVLSLSMRSHQKFFPLYDQKQTLSARFVAVANLDSSDSAQVIAGYQRVIEPRLSDAAFFWNKDRQQPLAAYATRLDQISFQQQLGSVGDKARRMGALASWLAQQLQADTATCARAAELALCDLSTDMVGEFPELQGIMGRHYALACGESDAVAAAIEQHYQPRGAGDSIAASLPGQCLAIAEKCDRLLGIFAAGKKPDGNKDPFALRRAALGLVRTVLEGELRLNLDALLQESANILQSQITVTPAVMAEAKQFILDRLQSWLEQQGISVLSFRAVAAISNHDLLDMHHRTQALQSFADAKPEAAASLAAANKRVVNLFNKAGGHTVVSSDIDTSLFEATEEEALFDRFERVNVEVSSAVAAGDYPAALAQLATLQQPVDGFFDQVMVMTEDTDVRRNRLSLLHKLRQLCNLFADIALLDQPAKG